MFFIFINWLIELFYFPYIFHPAFANLVKIVEALFVHTQLNRYVFIIYINIVQRFKIYVFFNLNITTLILIKLIWLIILSNFYQVRLWKIYSYFIALLHKVTNFNKTKIVFILKCQVSINSFPFICQLLRYKWKNWFLIIISISHLGSGNILIKW